MAPKAKVKGLSKVRYDVALLNIDMIYDLSQADFSVAANKNEFKVRYVDLDTIYQEFLAVHLEISAQLEESDEPDLSYLEKYKMYNKKYYDIKRKYLETFPDCSGQSSDYSTAVSYMSTNKSHTRV